MLDSLSTGIHKALDSVASLVGSPAAMLAGARGHPHWAALHDGLHSAWAGGPTAGLSPLGLGALGLAVLLAALALRALAAVILRPRAPRVRVPFPKEAAVDWAGGPVLESPTIRDPKDVSSIRCYDPATGTSLGSVPALSKDAVKQVVARSRAAQESYKTTTFATRRAILQTLYDFVLLHQEEICRVAARDSGKTVVDAVFGEILTTLEKTKWTQANGEALLQPSHRSVGSLTVHKAARVEYVPIGVMGCIVSWNYPFHNAFGPVISAIMAGCGCVVKCSEWVAWSTGYWESIIKETLVAHGQNPDLISFVNGHADAGEALVESSDKITFIGSPAIGKLVMKHASATLTPVVLELGGKDAAVLCDDCDLAQAVDLVMRGTFQNAGQNCIGLERLIVHQAIYSKFVGIVEGKISALRVGPPSDPSVDMGAMTMASYAAHIQPLIDDAVAKGARLLCGGKKLVHPKYLKGQFYLPTLLVDVTPAMRIAQEEVFGPVMVIMQFADDAQAIALANSSPYALGASVFSLNGARAAYLVSRIRSGMCNINDFAVNYLCQSLPFGGVGESGFERFAGEEGLRGCCYPRALTQDRFWGVRTNVPGMLQYPLKRSSADFLHGLSTLVYAPLLSKATGLSRMGRAWLSS